MKVLELPRFEDVPQMARFLEGTHNYDMDKHTRLIYHPISGIVYKRRFVMAMEMLARCVSAATGRIVEIGYGAGLLFPSLSRMARSVVGVDLLDTRAAAAVRGMLDRLRLDNVTLVSGSVMDIPLAENSVDALLCLSVLEHLHRGEEMQRAAATMSRVLRPGGVAVLGFPVKNKITRTLFRILGYDDEVIHPSSHRDILNGYQRADFRLELTRVYPAFVPLDLSLYALAQVRKAA
jgi:2-polyprenyl-3-methyl-5-hydroxy-6-metoxy-1,4-benzoquinol methylase